MMATTPGAGEAVSEEEEPSETLETADRIEARKQAEKKEEEARSAAQAIVEYVEGKAALKEQISLEKELLKTAKESLVNLQGLLATREKLLEQKIGSGAEKPELLKIQKEIRYIQAHMKKLNKEIDERNDHLGDLYDELERLREEQIRVMKVVMTVAREFCQDPEFGSFTIGQPQMLGVDDLGDASFRIKFVIRTKADKMWPVRREVLRRIKNKFDELGIQIQIPHRLVLQPQGKASLKGMPPGGGETNPVST